MCKSLEVIEKYFEFCNDFKNEMEDLNEECANLKKQIREIEIQLLDLRHFIENDDFDVVQGYYYAKSIKTLRNDRRKMKNELETLKLLKNGNVIGKNGFDDLKMKQLKNQIQNKNETLVRKVDERHYRPQKLKNVNKKNIKGFCTALRSDDRLDVYMEKE